MIKMLSYLLGQRVATTKTLFPDLDEACLGLPKLTTKECEGSGCNACAEVCPTAAITVIGSNEKSSVALDRGACIACGLCIETCPTGTIERDLSTKIAVTRREDLIQTTEKAAQLEANQGKMQSSVPTYQAWAPFHRSFAVRVVSCGCSACDMEIGAAGNPVFDMDRFGVSVVASPRFADGLVVTGPASKGMQSALLSCYDAMSEPRVVIAAGTCAISGGVHKNGYAEANGIDKLLPVSVYIPGCPPHPWSIIHGIALAMGKIKQ